MRPSACIGVTSATMLPTMGWRKGLGAPAARGSAILAVEPRPGRWRAGNGRDALHAAQRRAVVAAQPAVLVGDDGQPGSGLEQLAAAQQEVGPRRPADLLVAGGEGLVDPGAAA